jgi:hypothetical protein
MDMEEPRRQSVDLEKLAWGMLLVWWGLRWLLEFLPNGTGLMGTGVILLGLNAARSMRGEPTRRLTTMLGLVALFLGGLLLASAALPLPVEIPVLEALLIGLGGILVVRELIRVRRSA